MKKILYILLPTFILSGCATMDYTYQPQQAPVEEHRTIIAQWENEFQASDYPKKLSMLKSNISVRAKGELSVLNGISTTWYQSIHSGGSFGYDIAQGLAAAEAGGWVEIYRMYFSSIKKAMGEISNPPAKYAKAYDLLLELFSIYSQLYSLARSPQGSYVSFNKTVNDLSLEFDKCFNKLDVTLSQ